MDETGRSTPKPFEIGVSIPAADQEAARFLLVVEPTPYSRGPQNSLLNLLLYVTKFWDVTVAAPRGFLSNRLKDHEARFDHLLLGFKKSRYVSWAIGSLKLLAHIRQFPRTGIVQCNGLSALNLVAPAARVRDFPIVVYFKASELPPRSVRFVNVWRRMGVRLHFVAPSEVGASLVRNTLGYDCEIIPNSVPEGLFEAKPGHEGPPFHVGFLGSPLHRKGFDILVSVAALLREMDVHWHIVGISEPERSSRFISDSEERARSTGVDGSIRWYGEIEDPWAALPVLDALLVPSRIESFCMAALEAMARGVPVVASDIPGLRTWIDHERNGMLFPPEDAPRASKALTQIFVNRELRQQLIAGGLRTSQEHSPSSIGSRFLKVYERVWESDG